ncbi:MAG: hypothetical protein H7Z43_14350 [Clostridia bacterium]|nr:hypothetical protein [Deltaproteobacteria bacterium]
MTFFTRLPVASPDQIEVLNRDTTMRSMTGPLAQLMAAENPHLHDFFAKTVLTLYSSNPIAAASMVAGALSVYSALALQLDADNLREQVLGPD